MKQRILTALVLAPLALALIFLAPIPLYALVFAAVAVLGAWEWAGLAGGGSLLRTAFGVVVAATMAGLYWLPDPFLARALVFGAGLAWLVLVVSVLRYPRGLALGGQWLALPLGWLVLCASWWTLVHARALADGSWIVLYLFAIVWGADIGAYFVGRRFGRRKLAAVSPGKTWEGVAGGAASGMLLALAVAAQTWLWAVATPVLVAVTAVLLIVSVFGDLAESLLKRQQGVKDSGNLLPGHGGVLDRIDSLLAVAPLAAVLFFGLRAAS